MKYQTDDAVREILKRSEEVRKRRERTYTRVMAAVTLFLTVSLVSVISVLSKSGIAEAKENIMGSFILTASTGGYVLVAVIGFIIGVLITMLTQRYRSKK